MQRMRKISMFDEINKDKMNKETEPAIYDKFAQVEVKKEAVTRKPAVTRNIFEESNVPNNYSIYLEPRC